MRQITLSDAIFQFVIDGGTYEVYVDMETWDYLVTDDKLNCIGKGTISHIRNITSSYAKRLLIKHLQDEKGS